MDIYKLFEPINKVWKSSDNKLVLISGQIIKKKLRLKIKALSFTWQS